MGRDHTEAQKRGQTQPKMTAKHPIAALEKRIMDSVAYADLAFSSRAVLFLLCRNIDKNRNGHIQLSETQAASNGIERKTLRRAFSDLIAHQLIVMTWRGGKVQGSCNKYGLTWMPIKDRQGIQANHFKLDAWRDWKLDVNEKQGGRKCPQDSAQNVPLKAISSPKISPTPGDKKGPIEVIAIPDMKTPLYRAAAHRPYRYRPVANPIRHRLNPERPMLSQLNQGVGHD
jgi:hypothetical protein